MDTWSPEVLFWSRFAVSGLAALFALMRTKQDLTVRAMGACVGFYAVAGGCCAPLVATLPLFPASIGKGERVLIGAFGIGAGFVPLARLLKFTADKTPANEP